MTDTVTPRFEPVYLDCAALIEGEYGEFPAMASEAVVHVAVDCPDCHAPLAPARRGLSDR